MLMVLVFFAEVGVSVLSAFMRLVLRLLLVLPVLSAGSAGVILLWGY
jgi:hypothetical protein